MIIKLIVLIILSSIAFNLNAVILKHEILNAKYEEYTFKEVCEKLGAKNLELIEAKSMTEIDCMGKVFPAVDFCSNKFPMDRTLTRAIIDEKNKKLRCEFSASVMIAVSCDARDLKYCFKPEEGCEQLKKIYANRLSIAHFSMLEKNLNCYFAKPLGETLNESR